LAWGWGRIRYPTKNGDPFILSFSSFPSLSSIRLFFFLGFYYKNWPYTFCGGGGVQSGSHVICYPNALFFSVRVFETATKEGRPRKRGRGGARTKKRSKRKRGQKRMKGETHRDGRRSFYSARRPLLPVAAGETQRKSNLYNHQGLGGRADRCSLNTAKIRHHYCYRCTRKLLFCSENNPPGHVATINCLLVWPRLTATVSAANPIIKQYANHKSSDNQRPLQKQEASTRVPPVVARLICLASWS
jgi:hypothetical protein